MKKLLLSLVLVFAALPSFAQTILLPTTLSAAVTSSFARTIVVASATNCVAGNMVYVDRELAAIISVNSTTLTVQRGAGGTTASPHINAATAFCGVRNAFSPTASSRVANPDGNMSGSCTRGSQLYLPVINPKTGTINDCLGGVWTSGSTTNGAATSAPFQVLSPDPGSAALTGINTNGTAVGATTLYCSEVNLKANKVLTGIGVLNGTTVTGNLRYVVLYDSAGNAIANSALAGQASVTASVYENYAFTSPFFAVGPQRYFACIQDNAVGSTTVRMVVTSLGDHILTKGQTSAVFGTVAALVPPTTFTSVVGPWVYLY